MGKYGPGIRFYARFAKILFFRRNILCIEMNRYGLQWKLLHNKKNQPLEKSFFKRLIFFCYAKFFTVIHIYSFQCREWSYLKKQNVYKSCIKTYARAIFFHRFRWKLICDPFHYSFLLNLSHGTIKVISCPQFKKKFRLSKFKEFDCFHDFYKQRLKTIIKPALKVWQKLRHIPGTLYNNII